MIKFVTNLIKKHSQFFKYCVGGGTAFVVDFSLLYVLTEFVGFWYLTSATISFVTAVFVNYLIQRFWTFKSNDKGELQQFVLFLGAQVVGLFINNTTMYVLVEHAGMWYILSKAVAAAIVLIWNFWVSKAFIFNIKYKPNNPQIIIAAEIFPPDIGGSATYAYNLAKYLIQHNYNIKILCYSTVLPAREDEEFGNKIIRVSSFLSLPVKYFIYFIKLLDAALHAKVIYAQGLVASGLPALLVSKILHKKLVIKVTGDYGWEQAQLYGATGKSIDDWRISQEFKAKSKVINLKSRLINWIQKITVRNAARIITPSYYLKDIVAGWGVNTHKIKVIYNSVEYKTIKELSKKEAQAKIEIKGDLIITVGRLMPWKGVGFLIKLMPELKKINPKFKLVIIGSGLEEKKLKDLIQRKKLTDDVIMTGRLPHKEIANYYLAAEIFVLNSSYVGFSHVILDAMYYHLPIIANKVGGNPELIQDDYNGLLVEYNNQEQWLRAIKKLWQNKALRKRLCADPVVKLDVFNFDNMIKQTMQVLNK